MNHHKDHPLVVDLDGTLIKTDILMEQVIAFVRENPWRILLVFIWFIQGYAKLKYEVYRRTSLNVENLPLNDSVIKVIKSAKDEGRKVVLATASFLENALEVAKHLNLFDEVLATTINFNLRGRNKAKVLVEKFGEKQFDYVGDSFVDLEVWKHARIAYLVNPSKDLVEKVSKITQTQVLTSKIISKTTLTIRAIRLQQWSKNLLLFAPALLAHKFDFVTYLDLSIAFVAFSLMCSAVYLLNDLNDLENDRKHPIKRFRPLASGDLHLEFGLYLALVLLLASFVLNILIANIVFSVLSLLYLTANYFYSKILKQLPIVDITILSSFYILRIYAGSSVSATAISEWLIMFSIFTFISLAILKRYTEIALINDETTTIRGYSSRDKMILLIFGITLSLLSSVIYLFYTQSKKVELLYSKPIYLIFICPLIIFFYLRLWLKVNRKVESDNPIDIVLTDEVNYILLFTAILFLFLAN